MGTDAVPDAVPDEVPAPCAPTVTEVPCAPTVTAGLTQRTGKAVLAGMLVLTERTAGAGEAAGVNMIPTGVSAGGVLLAG
mmetsp:Transcript_21807/g.39121  ORF Transcript_21807/g.39121 Transcript_21807/m.39121 type:complete len:80 (-) Transcript_21807:318-557(-)